MACGNIWHICLFIVKPLSQYVDVSASASSEPECPAAAAATAAAAADTADAADPAAAGAQASASAPHPGHHPTGPDPVPDQPAHEGH